MESDTQRINTHTLPHSFNQTPSTKSSNGNFHWWFRPAGRTWSVSSSAAGIDSLVHLKLSFQIRLWGCLQSSQVPSSSLAWWSQKTLQTCWVYMDWNNKQRWVRKEYYAVKHQLETCAFQEHPVWMLCPGLGEGEGKEKRGVWTRQNTQLIAKFLALLMFPPTFLTIQELL